MAPSRHWQARQEDNPMMKDRRFATHVSIPEAKRDAVVARLNTHLGSTIDLYSQVKQAHWTLKGPQFFARHELFDAVAKNLRGQSDTVAERISTLGGYPLGTIRMAARTTTLQPFDDGHVSGAHLLRDLIERFAAHAATARETLVLLEQDDPISADLMTEHLRQIELDLWFFESHFAE
jgi:starvation-inducible DNA-binding protein